MTVPQGHGITFGETVREAVGNLRARGQRSALALLGIVVGVASIIAMLNIGHIAQLETLRQFARLGIDIIQIQGSPNNGGPAGMDRAKIEGLSHTDPDVLDATPLSVESSLAMAGPNSTRVMIVAAPPKLMSVLKLEIAQGRALRHIDDCSTVAVVGERAAGKLSKGGGSLLGQEVALHDYLFTVVGILAAGVQDPLSAVNYDDAIMIPLSCSRRVLAGSKPTQALIKVRDGADVDRISERLTSGLANDTTSIRTISAKMMIEARNSQKAVHAQMLAAIGGISLLVGGIGVMNVMLMNVMERRKEIGLRAAIGATPLDIQVMFLLEAAMLAMAGGLIGALIGLLASFVVADLSGWTFSVAYKILPLGPLGAGVIGLLFGIYPALAASRIDPIEALRAD